MHGEKHITPPLLLQHKRSWGTTPNIETGNFQPVTFYRKVLQHF